MERKKREAAAAAAGEITNRSESKENKGNTASSKRLNQNKTPVTEGGDSIGPLKNDKKRKSKYKKYLADDLLGKLYLSSIK